MTTISCHAAGGRALGAADAGVGATVLRGGQVGGDRLSFCQRAGTSLGRRREEEKGANKHKKNIDVCNRHSQCVVLSFSPERFAAVELTSSPVGYPESHNTE